MDILKNKSDGIETIRYLFNDNNEYYDLRSINNKQYQSFSDRNLLPFYEYLERIRLKLIKFMSNSCKAKFDVNVVFKSETLKKSNNKINIHIKSKNTTDINEMLTQLIEKHEKISEYLKDIDFISEGIYSIVYNFITTNTFVEFPVWKKINHVQLIH